MEMITIIGNKDFSKFITFEYDYKEIVKDGDDVVITIEDDSSRRIKASDVFQARMPKDVFDNYTKDKEGFWYVRDTPESI